MSSVSRQVITWESPPPRRRAPPPGSPAASGWSAPRPCRADPPRPAPSRERFSSPSRTMTWQVVQAQLPPQLCSRWMSWASAMSSSEPGLPWSASGYFASSTSTVTFERQEGHLVHRHHYAPAEADPHDLVGASAPQRALERRIHHAPRPAARSRGSASVVASRISVAIAARRGPGAAPRQRRLDRAAAPRR